MGKLTCCEELALDRLKNYMSLEDFAIGLIIGQMSEEENFIIHFAPFPQTQPDNGQQSQSMKLTCLASISETNLASHARQVSRMLPGGLDIIGIYSILDFAEINKSTNQEKIKKLLHSLNNVVSKHYLGLGDPNSEMIFFYGCGKTSKLGIKYLSLLEENASLTTGEMKPCSTTWIEVDYTYSLSQNLSLLKESTSQVLSKSVFALLQPWALKVFKATILIDNQLRNEEELLHPSSEERTPKKRLGGAANPHLSFSPPKIMKADFLEKTQKPLESASVQEVSSLIAFSGTIVGRAFLNGKSTVKDALMALRKDLVRSLVSRWEMHCDSLIEEPPGSSTGPVLHEPPRRVFLEGGGLPVSVCDYLFPGDSATDACISAEELLDINVSEDNIDVSLETSADPLELLTSDSPIGPPHSASGLSRNNSFSFNIYLLSILVGIMSLCAFYLMFRSNEK